MITETVSTTKRPPTIASTISCLVATATAPSAPPSASEPLSPMKIFAGGALYQRKPRPEPTIAEQNTASLAHPGHEVELQIVGEADVADKIGDQAEGGGGDHHRHGRQAVEAVGKVHRIRGADDHERAEREVEPPQIDHRSLEDREDERGREMSAPSGE